VVRAVPALLRVFPRLDFAARIQILVNSIPTRVFLSVVVARCQQKTERRDEDASQSEHRGNGLKGRGIIYLKRIHRARVGTVRRSPFTVRGSRFAVQASATCRQSHKSYRSYKSYPLSYHLYPTAKRLQVYPETLQVITSWEIFGHWHLT
jgi:hypothetical protein